MQEIRLALIGFGNVAQGLAEILARYGDDYARQRGLRFLITAISDTRKGSAFHADGIDPQALVEVAKSSLKLDSLPGLQRGWDVECPGWDPLEMIANAPAEVVVEMTNTNLETGEPATSYIVEALRRKKHVVTSNKGPVALHFDRLAELAHVNEVQIGVEGTVMSGTPVLRVGGELMAPAGIRRIEGILNGTSNYILTQMEQGQPYAEALAGAQQMGFAEADPTNDVDGYDAAAKVVILARTVLGVTIPFAQVERTGIREITPQQIAAAQAAGERWKLIGALEPAGSGWRASVQPRRLPLDHPLARISGAGNALIYTTDLLGDVFMQGPGAGRVETGYAIIQDLFSICRE